ncbi:MAG: outer membrane protein assembly factor BamB family protein, partial [Thermoguttaceae bacterium]
YAVDASGTAFAVEASSGRVLWRTATPGGSVNCNNVSSPALAGKYLHFGTMAGSYMVLDAGDGSVVCEIPCGEPIFSAPVVDGDRVYFATLGSQIYALEPNGRVCWKWDFVAEVLEFEGNRWDGSAWLAHKKGRVTWQDSFCCSQDIAAHEGTIVIPAGGRTVWLADQGDRGELRALGIVPAYAGKEYPATFGQSLGEDGAVYRQWHRRDNAGRVEIFRLQGDQVEADFVAGTETAINLPGLLSFCSVSLRGKDVYRCRPERGLEFCRHAPGSKAPESLGGYPSIASPILAKDHGIYGGLDGRLHVVPLSGKGEAWSFATAFGAPISAPACVCDGRVFFGCEDGYLYLLGPEGKAPLPTADLKIWEPRNKLSGPRSGAEFDWSTNYGNAASTNANDQGLQPPLQIRWIRRYEGTFKHLPVCGGGRMYTHTSEGQIFAVEQETGRLLWRRYWPDVHLSFTSPLYHEGRLLVPQAGLRKSLVRCLDAATGRLQWEAPFSGSPSWSRQSPPIVVGNLAIYAFGTGKYAPQGTEKAYVMQGEPQPKADGEEVMSFIYTHNNPYYPKDNRPIIRAWDLETGKEAWTREFGELGTGGNDCGLCLMDGRLYYSTFFGYAARRGEEPSATGLTAALDPATGSVLWQTTKYHVTAGCTISGKDGRLYLGGYNKPNQLTENRYVWCLDARDGSLVWQSEPVGSAVNVISLGDRFVFTNASGKDGHVLDRETGKIVSRFNLGYACTRFTLSEPFVLGANMDLIDLSNGNRLAATGPAIDSRECVGSVVSNGRLFYTSQASGLQVSEVYGEEAQGGLPWRGEP